MPPRNNEPRLGQDICQTLCTRKDGRTDITRLARHQLLGQHQSWPRDRPRAEPLRKLRRHPVRGNDETQPDAGKSEELAEGAEDDDVLSRLVGQLWSGCMSPKASSTTSKPHEMQGPKRATATGRW